MNTIRDFQRNDWRKEFRRINAIQTPWTEAVLAVVGLAGMVVVMLYVLIMWGK